MQMTLIRGELGPGSTDLEEFEGLVPNFASLIPSLYRCGSCCWCWCCWWCWRWPPPWCLKRSSYHLSAGAPPASLQRLLTKLTLRSTQGSVYNDHAWSLQFNIIIIRFTCDAEGQLIVLGDYNFPEESNGWVLLSGSRETQLCCGDNIFLNT